MDRRNAIMAIHAEMRERKLLVNDKRSKKLQRGHDNFIQKTDELKTKFNGILCQKTEKRLVAFSLDF